MGSGSGAFSARSRRSWRPARRAADAPGAPGDVATWTEGDKDGMGTAAGTASKAWLTLDDGALTEVYAPDLGMPSVRDLQLVVTDGRSFAEREREDARSLDAGRPVECPEAVACRYVKRCP